MDRTWIVDAEVESVEQELADCGAILRRIGGAVSVVAHRVERDDGTFEPVAFLFRWDSFAPAERKPKPEPVEAEAA
jgi:hypothetical protein